MLTIDELIPVLQNADQAEDLQRAKEILEQLGRGSQEDIEALTIPSGSYYSPPDTSLPDISVVPKKEKNIRYRVPGSENDIQGIMTDLVNMQQQRQAEAKLAISNIMQSLVDKKQEQVFKTSPYTSTGFSIAPSTPAGTRSTKSTGFTIPTESTKSAKPAEKSQDVQELIKSQLSSKSVPGPGLTSAPGLLGGLLMKSEDQMRSGLFTPEDEETEREQLARQAKEGIEEPTNWEKFGGILKTVGILAAPFTGPFGLAAAAAGNTMMQIAGKERRARAKINNLMLQENLGAVAAKEKATVLAKADERKHQAKMEELGLDDESLLREKRLAVPKLTRMALDMFNSETSSAELFDIMFQEVERLRGIGVAIGADALIEAFKQVLATEVAGEKGKTVEDFVRKFDYDDDQFGAYVQKAAELDNDQLGLESIIFSGGGSAVGGGRDQTAEELMKELTGPGNISKVARFAINPSEVMAKKLLEQLLNMGLLGNVEPELIKQMLTSKSKKKTQ